MITHGDNGERGQRGRRKRFNTLPTPIGINGRQYTSAISVRGGKSVWVLTT